MQLISRAGKREIEVPAVGMAVQSPLAGLDAETVEIEIWLIDERDWAKRDNEAGPDSRGG